MFIPLTPTIGVLKGRALLLFQGRLINEQKFHLKDVQFSGQDKILSYQDLSSQIHSLNNLLLLLSTLLDSICV